MSPLPFLAWVFGSLVGALVLLLVAPSVLLAHGSFLSYLFTVVTAVWLGVDALDAAFEQEGQPARTRWAFQKPAPAGQWREISRTITVYEKGPDGRIRRVSRRALPREPRS